jgi:hypothetical protein
MILLNTFEIPTSTAGDTLKYAVRLKTSVTSMLLTPMLF